MASKILSTFQVEKYNGNFFFGEGYHLVLTSRFQSGPLERRFGQYRQMSGGRILVGLRDVTSSEKIFTQRRQ